MFAKQGEIKEFVVSFASHHLTIYACTLSVYVVMYVIYIHEKFISGIKWIAMVVTGSWKDLWKAKCEDRKNSVHYIRKYTVRGISI